MQRVLGLDSITMLFLTGLAHLGLASALWAFPSLESDRRLKITWLIGQLAGAAGLLAIPGLRGGSLFWFSTVPNTLFFVSIVSYVVLYRHFFRMPMGWLWWPASLLVLMQLGLRSLGLPDHLRLFWAVSGSVLIFALMLHALWRQRRSGYKLVPLLILVNALIIAGLLLRMMEALLADERYSFLSAGLGQELGVLALFVNAQANGMGFLMLMKERADKELVRLATLDSLTEVDNRRSFLAHAAQQLAQGARQSQPLSVLMCDIDHFKRINDCYGHAGGDEVIRTFVVTARQTLRAGDHIGRWGGEEFIVLLPNTDLHGAEHFALRLNQCFAEQTCNYRALIINATVSIGVAQHQTDETLQQTIDRADAALYRAKQQGRNRVETMAYQSAPFSSASV